MFPIDSLTHIALGACIGEAMLGKKLGKKGMLAGAVAQTIPDIDFVASLWLSPADNLLAHRGFTHSLLFDAVVALLLVFIARLFTEGKSIGRLRWLAFFTLQMTVHLFLDLFNNYGTGLLEPFSDIRFSLDALYVVDPFFTAWTIIASIVLLAVDRNSPRRKFWWLFGIGGSMLYLSYCVVNKITVEEQVRSAANAQVPGHQEILTTPAPLNNWLWFVALKTDSGYFTGYHSVFNTSGALDLHFSPKNENLIKDHAITNEIIQLKRFSRGWYTLEQRADTVVFNDLRFGQVIGWHDPGQRFAFHYYIDKPAAANRLVVQRGRFALWSRATTRSMIRKIRARQDDSSQLYR